MLTRLGVTLYWLGCGVAVICFLIVIAAASFGGLPPPESGYFALFMGAIAIGAWLAGRLCRYVLAGF